MKNWIFLLTLLCYACSSKQVELPDDIETVPVNIHATINKATDFIEKIEIIPLETNDSIVVGAPKKTVFNKEMDIYAIYSRKRQTVYTFNGKGKFIGCSDKVKGEGPEEYQMAVDMNINPYVNGIDLLNPYGIVYTYSPNFNFITQRTIKPEFYFDKMLALSPKEYVFTIPPIWVNQEVALVDIKTGETKNLSYTGTISSTNGMYQNCFYQEGEEIFFIPEGINYYFYRLDKEHKTLTPIIYLDFGQDTIDEDELPGSGVGDRNKGKGTQPNKKRTQLIQDMQERGRFLREAKIPMPMIKLFNRNYVYILVGEGNDLIGHYIYNRQQKKGYFLKVVESFTLQPCFAIEDNVLLSICDAYYLNQVVDTKLMSPTEIEKMSKIKEEDNPVIIKYYLRK